MFTNLQNPSCLILVYVNKSTLCCVIAENTDATLESFRHKMDAQDDDLLCSPFKFTRLVKGKRVTVGVKQEAFIKLKQCIKESHQATIYLIREETKTQESANHVEPTTSQDADREKRMSSHCRLKKPRSRNNPPLTDLKLSQNLIQQQGSRRLKSITIQNCQQLRHDERLPRVLKR